MTVMAVSAVEREISEEGEEEHVMMYEEMSPLRRAGRGGDQERERFLDAAIAVNSRGGPAGTTYTHTVRVIAVNSDCYTSRGCGQNVIETGPIGGSYSTIACCPHTAGVPESGGEGERG